MGRSRSGTRTRRRLGALLVVIGAALVSVMVGTGPLGALLPLAGTGENSTTFTTSTKLFTTTKRSDLPDAAASECDAPATDPVKVSETSEDVQTIATTTYIGPQTIYVGDNQQIQFDIKPGAEDIDTLVTIETVVTQLFQATAAGDSCAVVAAIHFTG